MEEFQMLMSLLAPTVLSGTTQQWDERTWTAKINGLARQTWPKREVFRSPTHYGLSNLTLQPSFTVYDVNQPPKRVPIAHLTIRHRYQEVRYQRCIGLDSDVEWHQQSSQKIPHLFIYIVHSPKADELLRLEPICDPARIVGNVFGWLTGNYPDELPSNWTDWITLYCIASAGFTNDLLKPHEEI